MDRVKVMLYGAGGLLGKLILQNLQNNENLEIILAGRIKDIELFKDFDMYETRFFNLDNDYEINRNIQDLDILLNMAGSYHKTALTLANACVEYEVHYLDFSKYSTDYETLFILDEQAKLKNIMLMPGIGFSIVPTDILATHLNNKISEAQKLILAIMTPIGGITQNHLLNILHKSSTTGTFLVNGTTQIVRAAHKKLEVKVHGHTFETISDPWRGDTFSVSLNSDIPNVETYTYYPKLFSLLLEYSHRIDWMLHPSIPEWIIKKVGKKEIGDISPDHRTYAYAKIINHTHYVESYIEGPDMYNFSAKTAQIIIQKVADGKWKKGFQTPGNLYGNKIIDHISDVKMHTSKMKKL
ncbi:saccharopine dehydrogenase NADP-binding domain-containing protein [Sediminitomix flava]|uniref:Saccharopine dehydrogenase-like protein n=1 Tax=Sediminitomix flava TaxID=379075 RepID=A0A315Z9W8_SEDFL|nr:saccharopine dehydrogenase NADP-binding domain-containing protein [Sediminitomix flava]PWJ42130.1 saccharopine dehydrogenase-like protein [Sediminitomix flava]